MKVLVTHVQEGTFTLLFEDGSVWNAKYPPQPVVGTSFNRLAGSKTHLLESLGFYAVGEEGKLPPEAVKHVWDTLTGVEKPC